MAGQLGNSQAATDTRGAAAPHPLVIAAVLIAAILKTAVGIPPAILVAAAASILI